jgi:transposase
LGLNPCGAEVFVFYNTKKDKLKILYYDKNGFCLWYKRLEKGRFFLPTMLKQSYRLTIEQLRWMLDGRKIDHLQGNKELKFDIFY